MTWTIKVDEEFVNDVIVPLVEDIVNDLETKGVDHHDEEAIDAALLESVRAKMDLRFEYYVNQLEALLYYGRIREGFDECYTNDIYEDVYDRAKDEYYE